MIGRIVLAGVMVLAASAGVAEAKRKPKPKPPEQTWRLVLYKSGGYGGDALDVIADVPELDEYGFDDNVSSFQVIEGFWQLCEGENYTSTCITVGPGAYPDLGAIGLRNNALESVRRMQPPGPPPPPPRPDLTRKVEARASYDAIIEGEGEARIVNEVAFRGITVRVTVRNEGSVAAEASTLRIEPGKKMADVASYIAVGEHECGAGTIPWPAKEGGPTTCAPVQKGEIVAKTDGAGANCAIPKLEPGDSARCVAVFSVLYNYLVPQFGDWYVVAVADSGNRVKEDSEKNNGAGEQIRVKGDDLPPP